MATPTVTYQDVIARRYDALETGDIPPLESFVAAVEFELDDYWPASGTFDDAAWDEAKARWDAAQLADCTSGELTDGFGK